MVRTGEKGTVFGMEWNGRGQNKRGWYLGRNGMGEDKRKEDGIWDGKEWERTGENQVDGTGEYSRKEDSISMEWYGREQEKIR
jgi:hypothetical protein